MRALLPLIMLMCGTCAVSAAEPWRLIAPIQPERALAVSPAVISAVRVAPTLDVFNADSAELTLSLPDGLRVMVRRSGGETRHANDFTWRGHANGDFEQQVMLTRSGDFLAGFLSLSSGIYELTPNRHGTLLMKLDSDRFPSCADAVPVPAERSRPLHDQLSNDRAPAGSANLIDVLMVFSPGTITQLGGQAQAYVFAQSAVDSANLTFENSQMLARFRLVSVRLTTRADSGDSLIDLQWLLDDVQVAGWRNEAGADMVSMISEFSNACGQGYVMGDPPGAGMAPFAFQVSARSCAVGNLSYAHEHGHNMGFQHNPENGSGPAFPYAYGHYIDGSYRTVMSYANPCAAGCTRRPYFSNPNVSYLGAPTGIADQRDNARAGNQTASIVAAFREAKLFVSGFE